MNLDKFCVNGRFLMLALDHRQSIKKLLNPQNPDITTDEQIVNLKREIIEALEDQFSAVLIDELGLRSYQIRSKPYIMPLEKSGSEPSTLEYTASELINFGASGAKLLVTFNPKDESASQQLETAKKAIEECKALDFPLFLEIITYGNSRLHLKGVSVTVKMFINNGIIPDVWKLEYPGSFEQCQEITRLVGDIPWILLTGGDMFDVFCEHLRVATRAGARGFLAGRALWQELPKLSGLEKEEFLKNTLPERFRAITNIASS